MGRQDSNLQKYHEQHNQHSHHHGHVHDHGEECKHGHDQNEECGHEHNHSEKCGCGHDHDHAQSGECGCGHDHHDHRHVHGESCGCGHHHGHGHKTHAHGHDTHHHEESSGSTQSLPAGIPQKVYILENLGCANCAAKMERKISALPEVEAAVITFATKKLVVASERQENLLPVLQKICASIESEVKVVPQETLAMRKKEKKSFFAANRADISGIGAGALLFAAGIAMEHMEVSVFAGQVVFVLAYLVLGLEIVWKALKNLKNGRVFDENFLMSVATVAAFAIGDFAEAVGVMLFYRVGEFFEDVAVERSRAQIMEAVDLRPEVVNLVDGDEVKEIPAGEAKAGDVILIRPGDRIPLDGNVLSGESRIDTSPVTGEPVPVRVCAGAEVISGCMNEQGVLMVKVTRPLSESMVTRILDSVENAAASKPKIDRFITRFARTYTPAVVGAAILTAVVPSLVSGDWNHWIYTAITFLVISCPCALVLSVPLAFFSGIGAGSKKGILFKGGLAIEALKSIRTVVMDKTGTVTKGNFAVERIVSVRRLTEKQILTLAADCELDSTHPIGQSITWEAKKRGLELVRPKEVQEISGKGIKAIFPEGTVLCGNTSLMEENGVDLLKSREETGGTEVLVAIDGEFEGYLIINDIIKEEAEEAVGRMKQAGLFTVMLTGDAGKNARAVARKIGIDEVHAQLLPQEKLFRLQDIRKNHGAVMFVGDGINDAPVLAGADVGAAMGSGADAAIEAADVVFMISSVQAIMDAVSIAKNTGRVAMQNVVFALAVKLLVVILGFAGFANMWMAVFADTGVAMLCVLNSIRILYKK